MQKLLGIALSLLIIIMIVFFSIKSGEIPVTVAATETTEAETAFENTYPATEAVTVSESMVYIINKNTMKFHYPYCHAVLRIKDENRSDFFGTRDEIIDKGYAPCYHCHP